MKYRIISRITHIVGMGAVEVFEIQRRRVWRWTYVETWTTRNNAEARILQLIGLGRPRSWWTKSVERAAARMKELATQARKLLSGNREA